MIDWKKRLPFWLFGLMVLFFVLNPFSFLDFPLDDAWIHRVYSQSFAHGHGFEYNAGQQEAGSTSPLWSIVSSPAHWFDSWGFEIVILSVKFIGIFLCVLSIRALQKIGEQVGLHQISWIAAACFALDPRLVFSALSGMEGPLVVALWLWSCYALLAHRFWLASFLMALMPTARPECIILFPFFILALLFILYKKEDKRGFLSLFLLPIPMVLWGLFCKQANGHWLPTTFYVKSESFHFGLEQIGQAWLSVGFRGTFFTLSTFFLLLVAFLFFRRTKNIFLPVFSLLLILAPGAYIFGVVSGRFFTFEGYYWTRWVESPALILSAMSALGFAVFYQYGDELIPHRNAKAISRWIFIALIIVTVPYALFSFSRQRYHLINDSKCMHILAVQPGLWINEHTTPDAVIALNDAGAIRYFGKRKTIDLVGLNNAKIAFSKKRAQAIFSSNWVVVAPGCFDSPAVFKYLTPVTQFFVFPEQYTVCESKKQAVVVVYQVGLKKEKNIEPQQEEDEEIEMEKPSCISSEPPLDAIIP